MLFARIYAICRNDAEAVDISRRLSDALAGFSPVQVSDPYHYWKIAEYFGFEVELLPDTESSFREVVGLVADGWTHISTRGELSSVWNSQPGSQFCIPEVRWVGLELYDVTRPTKPVEPTETSSSP